MQYVNDDMDELFKRAAENYPLDTNNADWTKVLNALQDAEKEKTPSKKDRENFLWLLLLLLMGWICNNFTFTGNSEKENPVVKTQKASDHFNSENRTSATKNFSYKNPNNTSASIFDHHQRPTIPAAAFEDNAIGKQTSNRFFNRETTFNPTKEINIDKKTGKEPGQSGDFNSVTTTGELNSSDATTSQSLEKKIGETQSFLIEKNTPLQQNTTDNDKKKDSVTVASSKLSFSKKGNKKFYLGIMGGIDATTIKFQKIENAGSDAGLLFGYMLNKKWSIESGLFFDKKFYYTKGEYFNTSKVYIPSNSRISQVQGDCKMIEVPVVINYNFKTSKKSSWFSTAGMASYFMKYEDYGYVYYYPASGTTYTYNKSYTNSSTYLFSVFELSGGYTHTLKNFGDLRIQPYFKLPVSGMGIGKIPLLSFGLHIGITKNLF